MYSSKPISYENEKKMITGYYKYDSPPDWRDKPPYIVGKLDNGKKTYKMWLFYHG